MVRRPNDFYPTPEWATEELIRRYPAVIRNGWVGEPCAGDGAITKVLERHVYGVRTNDINYNTDPDSCVDATKPGAFEEMFDGYRPSWIVTNPPFKSAPEIVKGAYDYAYSGIAMLLRLSFLEPCKNRVDFLKAHPPTSIYVLPRISFTGDGRADTVTCAWMIWDKSHEGKSINVVSY